MLRYPFKHNEFCGYYDGDDPFWDVKYYVKRSEEGNLYNKDRTVLFRFSKGYLQFKLIWKLEIFETKLIGALWNT